MPEIKYVDCRVTILNDEETSYEDTYKDLTPGRLRSVQDGDALVCDTIERLNEWVAGDQDFFTREDLQLLGRHLYYLLFDENLRKQFEDTYKGFKKTAPENARLRLILAFHKDAAKIASYPWEFLFMPSRGPEPGFFLCAEKRTELILTRFVPEVPAAELRAAEESLKILVVFTNPREYGGTLNADGLLQQLGSLKRRIEVKVLGPAPDQVTKDTVTSEFAAFKPHIFHFVGHGDADKGIALIKPAADIEAHYDLHDEWKDADWVDSRGLGAIFGKQVPRLVFLHACEGAAPSSLAGFNSTARELVYSYGIPAVVAMQYVISNEAAGLFAQTFYQQIAAGSTIDIAVSEGRWTLRQSRRGEWSDRQFGTPLVYLQSESAIVLHQISDEQEDAEQVKAQRCPYGDACPGMLWPDRPEQVCVKCKRPVVLCEEGHVMAPEAGICPLGHRQAARPRVEAPARSSLREASVGSGWQRGRPGGDAGTFGSAAEGRG